MSALARYAWVIDTDHLAEDLDVGEDESGITGPSNAPDDLLAVLVDGKGRRFKMYDDDDELYYSGRWVGPNWACHDGRYLDETAFGPLWDFGTPNAGATEIRYTANGDNTGSWAAL